MKPLIILIVCCCIPVFCSEDDYMKAQKKPCPADPIIKYKKEKIKNLKTLQLFELVAVKAESSQVEMRVLVGRIDPDCNPNLREYKQCTPNGHNNSFYKFRCPKDLYSRIVVQSTEEVKYISEFPEEPTKEDLDSTKGDIENYKRQTATFIGEIKTGVTKIRMYDSTAQLVVTKTNAFPIAMAEMDSDKIFIAGALVGSGRVAVFNQRTYLFRHYMNVPFVNNIARWVSRGNVTDLEDYGMSLYNKQALRVLNNLYIWDPEKPIEKSALESLLQKVKDGAGVMVFLNSAIYNFRNGIPIHSTFMADFFIECGIVPLPKYIDKDNQHEIELNFEKPAQFVPPSFELKLMTKSLDEFKKRMVGWLKSVPDQPGIFDNEVKVLLKKYNRYFEHAYVCEFKSTDDPEKQLLLRIFSKMSFSNVLGNLEYKAPGVFQYPGDTQEPAPLVKAVVAFVCSEEWERIPTGYYLPAGGTMNARLSGTSRGQWGISINFNYFNVTRREEYYKWPEDTFERRFFRQKEIEIYSATGGLVWFKCGADNVNAEFSVEFEGVITAPFLDLRDPESVKAWPERRQALAPWATVAGDTVVLVVPSVSVRDVPDLPHILQLYDKCLKHQLHLGGETVKWRKREIISSDAHILLGWMHAGYPIGVYLRVVDTRYPYSLFNSTYIENNGTWGIFHELGHNRQNRMWNWKAVGESTNNIFSARCDQVVAGRAPFAEENSWLAYDDWSNTRMLEYLLDKSQKWGDGAWPTLMVYMQLQNSFGWELYRQMFRKYLEYDTQKQTQLREADEQVKLDTWFLNLAELTGYNLAPTFDLWRVPVSQDAKSKVSSLPPYLPDDFMTQKVPELIAEIVTRYPGVERTVGKPIPEKIGPLTKDTSIVEGRKEVYFGNVVETGKVSGSIAPCWSRVQS